MLPPRATVARGASAAFLDAVDARPELPLPTGKAVADAASDLAQPPMAGLTARRQRPEPLLAAAALVASLAVNGALGIVASREPSTAPPPPPRPIRLVFAAPPPPPPPPPPRKGSGIRPPEKVAAIKPTPSPTPTRVEKEPRPEPTPEPNAAPAPPEPEVALASYVEGDPDGSDLGVEGGVPGGVEGGVEGGVLGGIVGGVLGGVPGAPAPEVVDLADLTIRSRVAPNYPSLARKAGVAGLVVLEIVVEPTGTVGDVRVVRSVPLLDAAAIAAVRQWRFEPYQRAGSAARARAFVEVEFALVA